MVDFLLKAIGIVINNLYFVRLTGLEPARRKH